MYDIFISVYKNNKDTFNSKREPKTASLTKRLTLTLKNEPKTASLTKRHIKNEPNSASPYVYSRSI